MNVKSGSIVLGTIRYFGDTVPQNGFFTVQMLCNNLSAGTTYNLQFSLDGIEWANAQESGTDITGTLADDVTKVIPIQTSPGIRWKILFAGVTTGTVNYQISQRKAN